MVERKRFTITAYRQKTGAKAPQRLLDLRRDQLEISEKVKKALSTGPRTVPEVARESGIPPRKVLWYMMTYFKYGLIAPSGKTEDGYYRYSLKEKNR
jgi:hypothetical protein